VVANFPLQPIESGLRELELVTFQEIKNLVEGLGYNRIAVFGIHHMAQDPIGVHAVGLTPVGNFLIA
jgi:hypothetical protein